MASTRITGSDGKQYDVTYTVTPAVLVPASLTPEKVVISSVVPVATVPPPTTLPWTAPNPLITNFKATDGVRWTGVGGREVSNHNGNKAHSLTRPDSQTLRFEVRSKDQWPWDASHGTSERSEMQWVSEAPVGSDFKVNYEFMIEAGPPFTSWFLVLEQIQTPPGGTPPFFVGIENNKHVVRLATDQSQTRYVYPFRDTVYIKRGHWYQMQVLVNFTKGVCDITRDGVKIVNYRGPFGNTSGGSGSWQIGIYRNAAPETMAINYRNLVIV